MTSSIALIILDAIALLTQFDEKYSEKTCPGQASEAESRFKGYNLKRIDG
jgi:hypothetical protein